MSKPSTEAERRAERLARALRANLGRRKEQARARRADGEASSTAPPDDTEKPQAGED